jgi:hypothetical protein
MLQPMDLGVFQWLKNAHQKRLRDALRKGNLSFNRRDFAGSFKVCVISFNLLSNTPLFTY